MDSRCVRDLLHVMSDLTLAQRRDFLQFVTGSPKLPIGGQSSPVISARTTYADKGQPQVLKLLHLCSPSFANPRSLHTRLTIS